MKDLRGKRVLVTGGAGFIGSHLVESLLKQEANVTVLDNLATGKRENLPQLSENLQFHQVDVSDLMGIKDYFVGIDYVFHLAALADIVPSIQMPLDYHKANVDGTVAVLEASRQAKVKRFVYTASSSCYGIPESFPTSETAAIQPMYPYAFTKYIGEQYAFHWHKIYKLPVVSLRLFNVFGPRSRTSGTYGAVFGVFLAQKLANKPLTVVGDGQQTRDFTYVDDVVRAFVRAAESDVVGEALNVGSGGTYSINHLVSLLGGDVVHIPKRPGEPDSTFADIKKIQKTLAWNPSVSFEIGVQEMLERIEQWKTAPVWDEKGISAATKDWFAFLE
ncbi:MAG: UDP-glucose 4-epimerase [Chlamydiales bacterium]|jgi:UDP-glucose 4-epimerase